MAARKNLFVTGRPGVGKTTLIRNVLDRLCVDAGGFYTHEIRESGRRVGFAITDEGVDHFVRSVESCGVGQTCGNGKPLPKRACSGIEKRHARGGVGMAVENAVVLAKG